MLIYRIYEKRIKCKLISNIIKIKFKERKNIIIANGNSLCLCIVMNRFVNLSKKESLLSVGFIIQSLVSHQE